jgi:MFS family permease
MVTTRTQPPPHAQLLEARTKRGVVVALSTFAFLILVSLFALYMGQPPAAVPANAPLTEFSSGRAMQHLKVIGRAPHPMGSSEHAVVRDYILKQLSELGLAPEVQKTTAFNYRRNLPFPAGAVENIVGRLKGLENQKPLLLVCHYDSVANGPGVSDDGAAVAAMLETLRALKQMPPLKNDVLFLFTDGEEVGLLGVEAFINSYPAAKDAGVVLNFEARGSSGPVVMFETSAQNNGLIREFATAAPYPVANSLMYEVYRFLPNDTDLRELKNAGLPGLNFAFINHSTDYHTRLDNIENLDERSLQHHGSYALALARHFGNLNLPVKREGNAVYFDLLSRVVLHYPASLAIPLALLNVLLFLLVGVWGVRKKALAVLGLLQGFLALFLSMMSASLIISLIWWLLARLIRGYSSMPGDVYHSSLYFVGFIILTAAITTTLFVLFGKRIGILNLWGGAMVWWLLLMVASAIFLPGASYLFTWPLFFSLIALGGTIALRERSSASWRSLALLAVGAIPVLILFSSLIQLLLVGLTVRSAGIVMVLVALVLGLLAPHISLMTTPGKWFLPGTLTAIGLGIIIAGSLTSGFSPQQPQPVNLIYCLNADTGNAVWASTGNQTDGWTPQFLSQETQRKVLSDFFPYVSREYQTGRAPAAALAAPNVEVLDENSGDGLRTLRLHITSLRQAPVITVAVETDEEVQVRRINERELEPGHTYVSGTPKNRWAMRFYALPSQGVELTLQVRSPHTVRLKVVDQSYSLPNIPNVSVDFPNDSLMWAPFNVNNSTLVSRSFTF